MPTLSGRPAALSEAGTALRPSDALATCSCELEAVPDAPLRAREPHSAPQHSAARRLPREPLAASHRPPTALPSRRRPVAHGVAGAVRRPSATVAIGSCEPEAAHSAALPVREPHSVPQTADRRESRRRCSPPLTIPTRSGRPVVYHAAVTGLRPPDAPVTSSCELGAALNAAPRARKPHSTPQRAERRDSRQRRYIASGHDHPQQASRRAPRGRDGPKAVRRSGHQLMRARGRTQRCPPSERASQRAAARRSA